MEISFNDIDAVAAAVVAVVAVVVVVVVVVVVAVVVLSAVCCCHCCRNYSKTCVHSCWSFDGAVTIGAAAMLALDC